MTSEILRDLGYDVTEFLLTPLQFNIPNSRMRYYLLARLRNATSSRKGTSVVLRHIPGLGDDWIDPRGTYPEFTPSDDDSSTASRAGPVIHELRRYIKVEHSSRFKSELKKDEQSGSRVVPWHPCAIPDHVLEKWGRLFDIVLPSSKRSCCFTRGLLCHSIQCKIFHDYCSCPSNIISRQHLPLARISLTCSQLGYTRMVERSGSILQMNEALDVGTSFLPVHVGDLKAEQRACRLQPHSTYSLLHKRRTTRTPCASLIHYGFDTSTQMNCLEFSASTVILKKLAKRTIWTDMVEWKALKRENIMTIPRYSVGQLICQ
jgi:hypothetical protein